MALESGSYINALNASNPPAGDPVSQADDHIRLIKAVLKATFPNLNGPVTARPDQLNTAGMPGFVHMWSGSVANIPAGFALCDGGTYLKADGSGNVVAPDMRDKFVIAVGPTFTPGATGGNNTLTAALAGAHTPTGTVGPGGWHNHGGAVTGTVLSVNHLPYHEHFVASSEEFPGTAPAGAPPRVDAAIASGAWRTASTYDQYRLSASNYGANVGRSSGVGAGWAHDHGIYAADDHTHGFTGTPIAAHTHSVNLPAYYALCFVLKL